MKSVVVVCLLVVLGCASAPPPEPSVTVFGTPEDQMRLAGIWRGQYDALNSRRDGDIVIRFMPGADAVGSVQIESGTAPSRVMWVRIVGRELSGAFEPYVDPECSCTVYATFTATVDGDEMRGQIRHRVGMNWSDAGTWLATRSTL